MIIKRVKDLLDYDDLVDAISQGKLDYIPLDYILKELEKQSEWNITKKYFPKMKNGDIRCQVKKEMKKFINHIKKYCTHKMQIVRYGLLGTSRIIKLEVFPTSFRPYFARFFKIRFNPETKSFGQAINIFLKNYNIADN